MHKELVKISVASGLFTGNNFLKACYLRGLVDIKKLILITTGFIVVVLSGREFFSNSTMINLILFYLTGMSWIAGALYYLIFDIDMLNKILNLRGKL